MYKADSTLLPHTAFLTSLRANLHLTETTDAHLGLSPSSDMSSSAASTPPTLLPTNPSSSSAPQLAATTTTTTTTDPPTQPPLPTLTTAPTTDPKTLLAALRLIADSVAQQRQSASRALIFHPLVLAAFTAVLALVAQFLYRSAGDLALVATTWAGLVMAALVGVRWAASGYIVLAERIGWRWLEDGQADADGPDVVLVSRWGEEVIGALVLRFVRDEAVSALGPAAAGGGAGSGKAARRSKVGKAGGASTACIRAWTVKLRFRGKGVGTGLLEDAVRVCRERGGDALDFAPAHASSFPPPPFPLFLLSSSVLPLRPHRWSS